jgi:hypothetical protein
LGEINLGFDAGIRLHARRLAPGRAALRFAAEVGPHSLGFFHTDRAGMRLLLRHSNHGQHIQHCPAFHFQFSGQIVNSNLLHSCFPSPLSR